MQTDSPDSVTLESLVDRYGVSNVLDHIGQICRFKNYHILETWDDKPLARRWVAAATAVEKCAMNSKVRKVSE